MKHEIVNVMERRDMYFKLALLKHNIPENFKTKSKLEYEHGPFIIVKTESDQEISIGFSVFQYKISKRQLKYPKAKWTCEFWNKESMYIINIHIVHRINLGAVSAKIHIQFLVNSKCWVIMINFGRPI